MPTTTRTNRSSAIRFIKWASGASLLLALCQLPLGGDPLIILLCLLTEAVCFVPIYLYGLGRTVGILYIGVWLAFSFSALLAKTLLLQPLDSNLFNPLLAFCIGLVGSVAFTIAAIAAYYVKPLQKNKIPPVMDPNILSFLAAVFFGIGVVVFFIAVYARRNSLISNIAVQFSCYIGFGFVCELASVIIRSNRRHVFSTFSVIIGISMMYFSISSNSKFGILSVGLAYILCMTAYRVRFKWPVVIAGVLALAFLSEVVFPAIHIVRGYRDRLNPVEVSLATVQTIGNLLADDKETVAIKDTLAQQDAVSASAGGYQNVYFGSQQVWLDRFTNIGFIDAIARRFDFNGPFFGADSVLSQTMNFLPQQLDPSKNITFRLSAGDRLSQSLGLSARDQNAYATVTLPMELFSAGGFSMILAVGVPLIFLMLLEINFLAFNFSSNVWSVSILLTYGMMFYASTYDLYIFSEIRQIPTNFVVLTGLILLAGLMRGSVQWTARSGSARSQGRQTGVAVRLGD